MQRRKRIKIRSLRKQPGKQQIWVLNKNLERFDDRILVLKRSKRNLPTFVGKQTNNRNDREFFATTRLMRTTFSCPLFAVDESQGSAEKEVNHSVRNQKSYSYSGRLHQQPPTQNHFLYIFVLYIFLLQSVYISLLLYNQFPLDQTQRPRMDTSQAQFLATRTIILLFETNSNESQLKQVKRLIDLFIQTKNVPQDEVILAKVNRDAVLLRSQKVNWFNKVPRLKTAVDCIQSIET